MRHSLTYSASATLLFLSAVSGQLFAQGDALEVARADLVQQTIMAISTVFIAVASVVGLGVSIYGVILLKRTLEATARTADASAESVKAALLAAEATVQSAQAAERSVVVQEAAERAFLTLEHVEAKVGMLESWPGGSEPHRTVLLEFNITNHGRTLAASGSIRLLWRCADLRSVSPSPYAMEGEELRMVHRPAFTILKAGLPATLQAHFRLPESAWDALDLNHDLIIFGAIEFRDVFDDNRSLPFGYSFIKYRIIDEGAKEGLQIAGEFPELRLSPSELKKLQTGRSVLT